MNVLFCLDITFSPRNGGIANASITTAKGLEALGHHCFFISAYKNTETVVDNQYFLPQQKRNSSNNKKWYSDFLIDKQIDVVINQMGTSPYSLWPIEWSKNKNVKIITVYHSSLAGLYSFKKASVDNPVIKHLLDKLYNRLFRIKYGKYYKKQVELSDEVVTLSKKHFPELAWFSKTKQNNKYVSIPNAINVGDLSLAKSTDKINEVLFVGRMSSEKQPNLLVDIWELIENEFPNWKLTFVGDGDELPQIKKMVNDKGLQHVNFVGYQVPWEYYRRAKIFCLTSVSEGFGLVLAEAMKFGTVPVAFNSFVNITEIIDDKISGCLVPPFSIQKFADVLRKLMSDEPFRERMSAQAKIKAEDFSLEKIAKLWNELITN